MIVKIWPPLLYVSTRIRTELLDNWSVFKRLQKNETFLEKKALVCIVKSLLNIDTRWRTTKGIWHGVASLLKQLLEHLAPLWGDSCLVRGYWSGPTDGEWVSWRSHLSWDIQKELNRKKYDTSACFAMPRHANEFIWKKIFVLLFKCDIERSYYFSLITRSKTKLFGRNFERLSKSALL